MLSHVSVAYHVAYLLCVGKVMGSMLGPNRIIAKDVKVVPTDEMLDARH